MPLRKWVRSLDFAIEGVLHAAKNQRHMRYHFYSAFIALLLSYVIGVSKIEFMIISIAVMAVLLAEMLNTSIEALVDLLSPEKREHARVAKDIAAGAVLLTAFGALLVGYVVWFPYLRDFFMKGFHVAKHTREEVAVISVVLVLIVVILLKSYFGKGHPLKGGMPSGHTALAYSVWMSVTFMTDNFMISLLIFALAGIIAQSRLITRTHTPLEVLLGAIIGAGTTFFLFRLFG